MKNLADETCERMVVASLIATPYTIFDVENILEERCFSNPVCRDIFNAVETFESGPKSEELDFMILALFFDAPVFDGAGLG